MRYLGAYILATMGGNLAPSAEDLKKILNSVGAGIEEERLEKVITLLKGKDLEQLMAEGSHLLASFSSGPVAATPATSTGAAVQAAEPAKEAKKEEPKEEEEEDDDMGFGLFD